MATFTVSAAGAAEGVDRLATTSAIKPSPMRIDILASNGFQPQRSRFLRDVDSG
jgi:hypothetical protein